MEKIQSIQFMRFVAAILVVFYHTTQAVGAAIGGVSKPFLYMTEFGASGVHIFFVVSGFIMVYTSFPHPRAKFSPRRFFAKRFARIYPTYWVCCALYLSFHYLDGSGYALTGGEVLGSLMLLPGYSYLIIGPGWTLAYELYFYLCFGVLMTLGLSVGLVVLSAYFVLSVGAGYVAPWRNGVTIFLGNSLLIEFLCGAAIAYLLIVLKNRAVPRSFSFALQGAAIVALLLGYFAGYRSLPTFVTWGIPSALLIAGLALNESRGVAWAPVRKWAFLGDSSYSLYLIHILLIDVLVMAYRSVLPEPGRAAALLCVIFAVACVAAGIVFYRCVERNLAKAVHRAMALGEGSKKPLAVPSP